VALLVTTLGFEEKFQVRAFIRHGRAEISEVLIVVPPGNDERKVRAMENLTSLLREAEITFSILEVDPSNFARAVATICRAVKGLKEREFVVNLSGGMRALGIETLMAFMVLGIDFKLEIELENLSGVITFDIRDLELRVQDQISMKILRVVKEEGSTLYAISKETGIPRSTVWRKARELQRLGFLRRAQSGRWAKYFLTDKGLIASSASSEGNPG
jgi:CRISPR-associated protein Csa3